MSYDFPETATVDPLPPLPVIDGVEIRHIEGAPGYAVTSQGQVLSCCERGPGGKYAKQWRRHSDCASPHGYQFVLLRIGGRSYRRMVHHLVLQAFVSARPPGLHCRHMNGVPWDNRPANLQWGTPQENSDDKRRHGTQPLGSKCPRAKLTEEQVAEIRAAFMAGDRGRAAMAKRYGVNPMVISQVLTGKNWKHVKTINYHDAMTAKGQSGREFAGFGLRFRTARRAAKLTTADIARVCRCSKQAVSLWECGHMWPSGDRLKVACDLMGVTVESIKGDDSPRPRLKGRPRTRSEFVGPKRPVGRPRKVRPEFVGPKRPVGRPKKPADDAGEST